MTIQAVEEEQPQNKVHRVQAERDLEANWEVDLAKKLEDYLLKICSGEITSENDNVSVNFAEAALLLQGSVQVYSRKVEYLYNLVLHALDFLSQKRQEEQSESPSVRPEQNGSRAAYCEENDQFWVSDDVPEEARNSLDVSTSKNDSFYRFVKPPANLVVLEGDCLDTTGDAGELESYLLATNDLYRDFILLDPCDAVTVNGFLEKDENGKGKASNYRGSSARKSFLSPSRRSGGTARKSTGKNQDANLNQPAIDDCNFGDNNCEVMNDSPACAGFDMGDDHSEPLDSGCSDDNEDDPWKPLNPHEPGNLKVKPFKKVKSYKTQKVNSMKQTSINTMFPLARIHGPISPELTEIWEARCNKSERKGNLDSFPLYEKLRQSLCNGGCNNTFGDVEDDNEGNGYDSGGLDFCQPDDEMPETMFMDEELPPHHGKHDHSSTLDPNEAFEHEDPSSQASLEDLCRSHLDALLANIAETENQTELATRVSSWKQKIEQNLEEQDSRPSFDIHAYGDRILEKLSLDAENDNVMSFADVVKGQEKHDIARTFSALLQLVNNGDVNLERSGVGGESVCYTAVNPFRIKLLKRNKRWNGVQIQLSRKRVKSPLRRGCNKGAGDNKLGKDASPSVNSPQSSCKFPVKISNVGGTRCTPEGKKRRSARFGEPVDIHSSR
ncbi:condensin-2 complex subunit H2 [Mercurialis annua]|uniref:condensin-2 complex subunit H2 n=1 Tax=Mercurialis annua TaxID=3986 RepID=UPI00215F2E8C|nr:condensin-2 complex subunit H2 [Mercurialis annua]